MSDFTVLVADGNAAVRRVISRVVEDKGNKTLQAPDGKTALAMARQHHPDAIIVDARTPGMDGGQFCRALREDASTRDIPVLMLSGAMEARTRDEAGDSGADASLEKPFSSEELSARVSMMVRRVEGGAPEKA